MSDKINLNFGLKLRKLRKSRNWSLLELSIRSSVNHNYLCDLENGRRNPSLNLIYKIASGFNITISELLFGVELI